MNPSHHGQGLVLVLLVVELGRLLLDVGRLFGIHRGRLVHLRRRLRLLAGRLVHLGRRLGLLASAARSAVATRVGHSQSVQLWRALVMFGGRALSCVLISIQRQEYHFQHQVAVHLQDDTRR